MKKIKQIALTLGENKNIDIPREYQILTNKDNDHLVKLVEDSLFSCHDFYCFAIEYCEVLKFSFQINNLYLNLNLYKGR